MFSHSATRPLGLWLLVTTGLNIALCTANAFGGDIHYWMDWISQLQKRGFVGLEANYPPVYMLWLWLTGRFYEALHLVPEGNFLLRQLVNTPVLVAHLFCLLLADRCLQKTNASDRAWNISIGFLALNPAVLMNGPIWGQVDMLYCLFMVLALYALIEERYLILALPLLCIALLTKFQTICIAPAVLPLLWHRRHQIRLWWGSAPALLVILALLLPYWLAGSLGSMVEQTYVKAASMYPYATYNGNNLWLLLDLNTRPDNLYLFDPAQTGSDWRSLFTPKTMGFLLFAGWSLWLSIAGFRARDALLHWRNAFLSALGFFLLLPGMHERYLFPAVVIALIAAARHPAWRAHALWLTVLSFANMSLVLHPAGGLLPSLFSALTLLFAIAAVCRPAQQSILWRRYYLKLSLPQWCMLASLVWLSAMGMTLRHMLPDEDGWQSATLISERSARQSWGELRINTSVNGRTLSVNGKRYAYGFGTHAESSIRIKIPPEALEFTTEVGLDDEARGGEVEFIIRREGRTLWQSGAMQSGGGSRTAVLAVKGGQTLELFVSPLGANFNDHADWLDPRFRLQR